MKLNRYQMLALLFTEILTLMSCRAGTGESENGHGVSPFPFGPTTTVQSTTGMLDASYAMLSTITDLTGLKMLDAEVEQTEVGLVNSEYCLEDTTTPKALTGESAAGTGFASGELAAESSKYANRNLYCMIENNQAKFSVESGLQKLKQMLCMFNSKKDENNPLKLTDLYGQDQEIDFVFSSECFGDDDLVAAQNTIGSLQGKLTFKKELEKDGWSEQLSFSAMNWQNENTSWTAKIKFGEEHNTLAFFNSVGEREGASEYVLLQTNHNGKLFIERQIMLLQTADFAGDITEFNGEAPYNYRMRFLIDANLEKEQLKISSLNKLDASWSTLTAYTESSEAKGKGFVYRVSGNANLDFASNAYVCYNSDDKTCDEFAVLESYTNISSCAPSASNCQESAPSFSPEAFSGFSMVADPETVGYKTPEVEYGEVDPLEFTSTVD